MELKNLSIEEMNEITSDLDNLGETTAQEILRKTTGFAEITIKANKSKIEVEQDYDNEMTIFIFEDESKLECSSINYQCVAK